MKIRNLFIVVAMTFGVITSAHAKSVFEQILGGVLQGTAQGVEVATLRKVIDNPSLQSADMKNYLANYRNGDAYMFNGAYANAADSYAAACLIATRTNDQYLKKLWTSYGWAQDTNSKFEKACGLAGISTTTTYTGGSSYVPSGTSTYSTGSSNTTTTTKSRVCSLCKGTGLKIHESYVGSSQRKYCPTCGKTVLGGHSHITCDMCKGTGVLNY